MTGRRRPSGCGAFLASDGRSGGLLEHCTVEADLIDTVQYDIEQCE